MFGKRIFMKDFKLFFMAFIFSSALFPSCASTSGQTKLNTLKSLDGKDYKIYSLPDKNSTYIYLRSYNPSYKRKLSSSSLLKQGINIVETKPMIANHIAIGFDLNDEFYGVTFFAHPNLSLEECSNTKSNAYMRSCKKKTSVQTVFALEVSKEEREAVKNMVINCSEKNLIHYGISQNFKVAKKGINAKFFGTDEKNAKTPEYSNYSENDFEDNELELEKNQKTKLPKFRENKKNNFVCSNFAAYVLYQNVPKTRQYFDENFEDILLVGPSDVASVPGFFPVFTSTWISYDKAIKEIKKAQLENSEKL